MCGHWCTVVPMTVTVIETQPADNILVRTAIEENGSHSHAVYVGDVRQRGTTDAYVRQLLNDPQWKAPEAQGEFWQIFIQRGRHADNKNDLTTGRLYPSVDAARIEKNKPGMQRAANGRAIRIVPVVL